MSLFGSYIAEDTVSNENTNDVNNVEEGKLMDNENVRRAANKAFYGAQNMAGKAKELAGTKVGKAAIAGAGAAAAVGAGAALAKKIADKKKEKEDQENNQDVKKEGTSMETYGVITNEDGTKTMIELSDIEAKAVMEAREALDEKAMDNEAVRRAANKAFYGAQDVAGKVKKAAGDAASKAKGAGDAVKGAAKAAGKKVGNSTAANAIGVKYLDAIKAIADKLNCSENQAKLIINATGAALAAGATTAGIVAAIKHDKKKKSESTNESVAFMNEEGQLNTVEITDEEYNALVDARLEMGCQNIFNLVLTNEEYEAIVEMRNEAAAK